MPLSPDDIDKLVAVIDCIIPADDYPSASEAGVLNFLLPLIEAEGVESQYVHGLHSLPQDFVSSSPEARTKLLMEFKDQSFVEFVARQTIEGYYANPENGGNLDAISWKMIGFEVTA